MDLHAVSDVIEGELKARAAFEPGSDGGCGSDRPETASSVCRALAVIEAEASALHLLAASLGRSGAAAFAQAVDVLSRCTGRVVVTGMGKSGLVGRKVAATFTSTGSSAHFLHPAEASHGDLGMIAPGDVVLALSKSGGTPELEDVLSYASRRAIPVIAITGRDGSSLARRAEVVLLLPSAPEACPLGVVPTTSTVMMLALGDALAVALMYRKQFTVNDFCARHPRRSSELGSVRAESPTQPTERPPLVHLDAPMSEAVLVMARGGCGSVGVIDEGGRLVGAITDRDMRRHMGPNLLSRRVGEIMSSVSRGVPPREP